MSNARRFLLCFVLGLASAVWLRAAPAQPEEAEPAPPDVLAYHDGDRIQGHLVKRTPALIIFQSDRFGELRVPAALAVVIPADQPSPAPVAATAPKPRAAPAGAKATGPGAVARTSAADQEAERQARLSRFSPARLTAMVHDFFGPWHGKVALSAEVLSNSKQQSSESFEMQLLRKWKSDEVQVKGRYDFSEANSVVTTDTLKADGLLRHDFPKDRFVLYRPSLEWNRASYRNGLPSDYLLMQQEFGAGLSVFSRIHRKVRIGASENLFDIWSAVPTSAHDSRAVESAFVETEFVLPWNLSFSQRGVYYYSFTSSAEGWENRIELSKKFTETLSTSIRQEIRRYNPNGLTQDYSRLKLLVGLAF